jgi:hypothetical protein
MRHPNAWLAALAYARGLGADETIAHTAIVKAREGLGPPMDITAGSLWLLLDRIEESVLEQLELRGAT